jgi:hypothetical protein
MVHPEANIAGWNWWKLIYKENDAENNEVRRKKWEGFLNFRGNRELLLYAQRHFLARRFSDYNPARKDLWEAHNRPWDFDHILPQSYFRNRKDGAHYMGLCQTLGNTIGNYRAWPYEDNRSDQAELAKVKLKGDPTRLEDSFLTIEEMREFSQGDDVRHKEPAARMFIEAGRKRLLRIYREWYETVGVSELIDIEKDVRSIVHGGENASES